MIFYNLIYGLLRFMLLVLKPFLRGKTKAWVELRSNEDVFKTTIHPEDPKIWIHASSGEIEYAKSFIREYKKTYPKSQIFASYSSLSATSLFKNILSDVTAFFPLNWDISTQNNRLLDFIKPDILIFSRTDFWPNLIAQAHRKNIKLATIAANPKMTFWSSLGLQFCCKNFSFFSCVEEEQVSYLQNLLPKTKVSYIPDTRFDQVFFRLSQNSLITLDQKYKYITLGSTWPKDDVVLKPIIKALLEKGFKIIWAPHDIRYAQSLANIAPSTVLLANYQTSQNFDVLVVDRIGVLADFYRYSKISFVGGSFVSRVHSVMEPLCAGNFVIVGPHYHNNPEAISFEKKNFVKSVNTAEEFLAAVDFFTQNEDRLPELQKITESKKGGSAQTVQAIAQLLKI